MDFQYRLESISLCPLLNIVLTLLVLPLCMLHPPEATSFADHSPRVPRWDAAGSCTDSWLAVQRSILSSGGSKLFRVDVQPPEPRIAVQSYSATGDELRCMNVGSVESVWRMEKDGFML